MSGFVKHMSRRDLIERAWHNPAIAFSFAETLMRGWYFRVYCRLMNRRVSIGKRFRLSGGLDIRGGRQGDLW